MPAQYPYTNFQEINLDWILQEVRKVKDFDDRITDVENEQILTDEELDEIKAAIAPEFNTSTAYAIGAYIWHNNKLYRFNSIHYTGAWNAAEVTQVVTMSELRYLMLAIAPRFDPAADNPIDSYVYYGSGLYKLPAGHAAGQTWANTTKTYVQVGSELASLFSNDNTIASEINTIEGDVADLKSAISAINDTFFPSDGIVWNNGYIDSVGAIISSQQYNTYYSEMLNGKCYIYPKTDRQICIAYYNQDGTFNNRTSWTQNPVTVDSDKTFRVIIGTVTQSTLSPSPDKTVSEVLDSIEILLDTTPATLESFINEFQAKTTEVQGAVTCTGNVDSILDSLTFQQGTLYKVIVTFYAPLPSLTYITIKDSSNNTFMTQFIPASETGTIFAFTPRSSYSSSFIGIQSAIGAVIKYKIQLIDYSDLGDSASFLKSELSKKVEIRNVTNWFNKGITVGTEAGLTKGYLQDNNARISNVNSIGNQFDLSSGYKVKISLLDNNYQYACGIIDGYCTDINARAMIFRPDTNWTYITADTIITATGSSSVVVMVKKTDGTAINVNNAGDIISVKIISPVSEDIEAELSYLTKWKGKKVAFVGDSITAGYSASDIEHRYYTLINNALDFGSIYVDGIAGSCWSVTSDYGSTYEPIASRWDDIPTDCDMILIWAGTNDYGHDTPIGLITDATDVSFYGAINSTIVGILTDNPTARLCLITPMHRYYNNTPDSTVNGEGKTLLDYVEAMKAAAAEYGIPVIDMYCDSGLNPVIAAISTKYFSDGLHPNDDGHSAIAERMIPYINML